MTVSNRFIKTEFLKHLLHAKTIRIWREVQAELDRTTDRCIRIIEIWKQDQGTHTP